MSALKTASVTVQNVFSCLTAPKIHCFNLLPGKLVFPVPKLLPAEAGFISAFQTVEASSCVLSIRRQECKLLWSG